MKAQFKILGLVIAGLISSGAFAADLGVQKPSTRIDFNKMINESNTDRTDLQGKLEEQPTAATKVDDKSKVMDFVDVEVGVGENRPIVDRRFN